MHEDSYEIEIRAARVEAFLGERRFPTPFWCVSGFINGVFEGVTIVFTKKWAVGKAAHEMHVVMQAEVAQRLAEQMLRDE